MAKSIRERLLEQVGKFHQWQEITYPGKNTEERFFSKEEEYLYIQMTDLLRWDLEYMRE